MIKNILLDLDDTIFDFKRAEREALLKMLESFGAKAGNDAAERYSAINKWHWKQLELGHMTRNEVLSRRFEVFIKEEGFDIPPETAREKYENNLSRGHYYMPGAHEALKRLKPSYRMYLVSNGTARVQYGRIRNSDLEEYLDGIFISQEIGFNKPDRRFFERAAERIPGYKREETVIIGDSLSSDIRGGVNSGIVSIWYNPQFKANDTLDGDSPVRPDLELNAWEDIERVLLSIQDPGLT